MCDSALYDVSVENFLKHLNRLEGSYTFSLINGRGKYDKIEQVEGTVHRSAYCFIEKTKGGIFKASSWSSPAKGARASIYDPETYKHADIYTSWLYRH